MCSASSDRDFVASLLGGGGLPLRLPTSTLSQRPDPSPSVPVLTWGSGAHLTIVQKMFDTLP
jgi:hypothetical protein